MRRLPVSATRRALLWYFDAPSNDPYVSLNFDVELAPVRAFLDAFAREHGERIGVQHVLTKAVARCLVELPALNVKILDRAIYQLDRVNVAMPVHLDRHRAGGDETGMTVVHGVDRKSLLEIARDTRSNAAAERADAPKLFGTGLMRRGAKLLPDRALRAGLDAVGWAMNQPSTYRLAPDLAISSAVTNVGAVFSLPRGARFRSVSATVPAKLGPVATVFGVAPAEDAIVADDGAPSARRVLPIVMIVDHRAVDGFLMATAASRVAEGLLDPASLA